MSTIDERKLEMAKVQYSSVPSIAAKQKESWIIYVSTGKWDTSRQKTLHNEAEAMRKQIDRSYAGSADGSEFKEENYRTGVSNTGQSSSTTRKVTSGTSIVDNTLKATVGMDGDKFAEVGIVVFIMMIIWSLVKG